MLKLIFDKEVKFLKKNNLVRQRWRLSEWRVTFRFMFVNIEPYKSKKCVPN